MVLDPFCGTGTTLVECKKLGIPSVGIESNPMAAFASGIRLTGKVDPDGLIKHATETARLALGKLAKEGITDEGHLPLFQRQFRNAPELKTLPAETIKLLLTDSISPLPLHKTLVLLETLEANKDERFHGHERLALAKSLVAEISNLHFGPEVGVGDLKADAPVIGSWLKGVRSMANDLQSLPGSCDGSFCGFPRRCTGFDLDSGAELD